jgi:hypothetical protein
MCQPRNFREAFRGWFTGICLTDEQLWCRVHGNQHPDCAQADCRAEEIRLTLYPIFFETVKIVNGDVERYGAMPDTSVYDRNNVCFDRIRQHILSLNTPPPLGDGLVLRTIMGVCVPSDDRRSMFLPICPLRTARCRSFSLHSALETFDELSASRRPAHASEEREPVGLRHSRSSYLGCHGLGMDEAAPRLLQGWFNRPWNDSVGTEPARTALR